MSAPSQWPADQVERRPLAALALYAKNARMHSDAQVDGLMASMREWGWTMPVLVDEAGEIIAGHGRIMAAKKLGAGFDSVPVMVARGWTPNQVKAYRVADNRLAELAVWDVKLLAAELGELPGLEALIGFGEGELEALLDRGEGRPLPSEEEARKTLAERFGLPPFSVLNAREGWWQERKRAWLALGIESELGRGENLLQFSDTINEPDPEKRAAKRAAKKMANGKTEARTFGQDLMRGEHIVGKRRKTQGETASLKGGLTLGTTADPYRAKKRRERAVVVAGKGWAEGGPARRDAAFYAKKRAWEKANGRKISTTEFREKHWNGAA